MGAAARIRLVVWAAALAAAASGAPAAAQGQGDHVYCVALGADGRRLFSDVFRGRCEPTVVSDRGRQIVLPNICRQGAPPASSFDAWLKRNHAAAAADASECFRDAEGPTRAAWSDEQRADRARGDEPVLTGWSPQ